MNRHEKLEQLSEGKRLKNMVIFSDGDELAKMLKAQFQKFKESVDSGIDINADDLLKELEQIVYLRDSVDALKKSINDLYIPNIPKSINVGGLEALIKVADSIAKKEIKIEKVDTKPFINISKKLDSLIQKIEKIKAPAQSQQPEDFIPMRRVMKVGNKLLYDDSFYTGGGGGSDVPLKNGSVPVVNPDGTNISGGSSGGNGAILDGVDSNIKATVVDYANSNPLTVRLSDTNGDYVAAGAGTQYTEDAATAADPVGGMLLARRKDTLSATEVSADGDNIALNSTNKGQLHVKLADTVTVDGSGVTQPVSGSVTANLGTLNGAATSAKQDTGNTSLSSIDGKITAVNTGAVVVSSGSITADTELTTSDLDTGAGTDTRAVVGLVGSKSGGGVLIPGDATKGLAVDLTATGQNSTALKTDASATTQPVSAASLPLPALASTSTKQSDGSQKTQVVDGSGNVIGATSNALDINIKSGNPTSITANAGTNLNTSALALESGGNLATLSGAVRAEDAASADAHTGIGSLAVRKATPADTSGTDGDYEFLQMKSGRLWTSSVVDTALPAGSNAIGKLAANDGVDIGDTTINNASGASAVNIQDGGNVISVDDGAGSLTVDYATTGSGTATGALRVELPTNGTGVVGLNAGTQVIGALSANQSVNNAQVSGTAVDTNSGTKSAGTQRVVLATDQPALTNKLLVTPDSVALPANQSVNNSQVSGNTISTGVGASGTGTQRTILANDNGKTVLSAGGSAGSSGNNTLVAAGTNKLKVKAFSLTTTSTTAVTCIFQSGAGGTELWRVVLQAISGASTGANLSVNAPDYLFATASATLLNLNLSSANAVHWSVSYYDEA